MRAVGACHTHCASSDPKLFKTSAKPGGWNSTQQKLRLGCPGAAAEEPKGSARRALAAPTGGGVGARLQGPSPDRTQTEFARMRPLSVRRKRKLK